MPDFGQGMASVRICLAHLDRQLFPPLQVPRRSYVRH